MSKTVCLKCKNEMGFAFGTCVDCGWNYLDHSYHFIKIHVSDIPNGHEHLIDIHDARALRRR